MRDREEKALEGIMEDIHVEESQEDFVCIPFGDGKNNTAAADSLIAQGGRQRTASVDR